MDPLTFTARYRGRCSDCSKAVEIGDEIAWTGEGTRMVRHAECIEDVPSGRMPAICSKCNIQHAGECM